jgi:hypothetical protein
VHVIISPTLPTLCHHPPHPTTMSTPFDLQKRMVAQEDKLVTLSDEVSSLKVDQVRLHVTVNNVQSKQLDKEATASQPSITKEAEKLNGDSSQAGGMANALLNAAAHKLCFPKYDGTEDPLPWLNHCEQFFRETQSPDDEKVLLSAFYMQGVTQQWYYRLECI